MNINLLIERPPAVTAASDASTVSKTSTRSRVGEHTTSSSATNTMASTPLPLLRLPSEPPQQQVQPYVAAVQTVHYPAEFLTPTPLHNQPTRVYPQFLPGSVPDPRLPHSVPITHAKEPSKKQHPRPLPHPENPSAGKKQSKWTADEDAMIVELRGNGMKWEEISKHLPGRSAISCRLRFQNYLERRSEWDEDMKDKLARLYERYKKDMWERISKEMQLPWRAVEAMHWQISEVEMAQRANVPVFHVADKMLPQTGATIERPLCSSASFDAGLL